MRKPRLRLNAESLAHPGEAPRQIRPARSLLIARATASEIWVWCAHAA